MSQIGRTIACIGGGPSLTPEDAYYALQYADVTIAINNAVDMVPLAPICYAADYQWWELRQGLPWFRGARFSLPPFNRERYPNVHVLRMTGPDGLELDSTGLRSGGSGGYQAINLAVHLQADRVLLLGYDMKPAADGRHHWHEPHAGDRHLNYALRLPAFETLVEPLRRIGVDVVNCTPDSALTTFPTRSLREVLRAPDVDSDSMRS